MSDLTAIKVFSVLVWLMCIAVLITLCAISKALEEIKCILKRQEKRSLALRKKKVTKNRRIHNDR